MATYQITAPSGKKYKITGPPGASQEDLIQQVKAQEYKDATTYGSDSYQYESKDTNFLTDIKDTGVAFVAGIPRAAGGIVSLGSYLPGVKEIADPLAKGLMATGDFIDKIALSDRQKELNEELGIRLQQAAGDLGPDASVSDYVDAIVSQGGEAGEYLFQNPGQAIQLVAKSLPYVLGGGWVGTAAKTGAKVVATGASKFGLTGTEKVATKVANMGNTARVAVGEGGISAGANVQQVIAESEEPVNMLDRYKTIPGGLITGLVGYKGALTAQKLGLRDVDLLLGGKRTAATGSSGGFVRNVGLGTAIEGGEEFLQSANEKISENWAAGRNLLTDVGGETVLGTAAGLTQGGIINTVRETANRNLKTPEVPPEVEAELDQVREDKEKGQAQQTAAAAEFVQGATAVNTPEELASFAAQQGVSVEEIQANPEFQRIQEEKATALEEQNKKNTRKKHAGTFLKEKEWIAQEQEDMYQLRRAEISNPETELGKAFDAWTEDDGIQFEGKLERDTSEVSDLGNPSEVAIKGFIKDNPSLFDDTLPSTYKTALDEHAKVQEENISDPKLSLQYGIYFKNQLELKNAAVERGDLQEAASIEANIDSMRDEDPLIKMRWNEFKRTAAVQAEQDAKEAKAAAKKKPVKTAAVGTTETTEENTEENTGASTAAKEAAQKLAEQKRLAAEQAAEDAKKANQKEIDSFSVLEQEDFISGATPSGPVEATASEAAAQQADLIVEPDQEITAEQKLLDLPQSKSKVGTKKRTRFDDAQIEFGRKGQNVEQTHPDLFKAINASVSDKVYDKRLEEARENQKLIDSGQNITEVGAKTFGDFDMPEGEWQRAIINVLEKASARGNLGDYITFRSYIQHTVKKGDTRAKIAKKYGLPVENIFGNILTQEQLDKEMQNKTFKTGKEKKAYLESINRVEKRTKVKGTGIGKSNPARYTVKYAPIKQKKTLEKGTKIQIPMSKTVMAALPIEEKYQAAEFATTAIAEEVINTNEWAKDSTPERGKKNVSDALESYRKKHIQVGNAANNPREPMIAFMERTAFAEAYSGSDSSNQQLEDYQQDSAYVASATDLEERQEQLTDASKVRDISGAGNTVPGAPGVQVIKTPGDSKEGTTDDFQSKQELRNLEAQVTQLRGDATRAETQAKKNPNKANKAAATRKRNLADDVEERITEIKNFKNKDKPGKVKKQRVFNEKDSLPAGQATPETLAQAETRDKKRIEQATKVLRNDRGKVIASLWDTNKLHLYTPSFSDLSKAQQREWASKVILAVNDEAIPDLKNQVRLMEDRVNENITRGKTESEEVVDGRSQTDTTKSRSKSTVKSNRKTSTKKISSKSAADAYGKEKLEPIPTYGKFWRSHPDNGILKRHLKNKDFGAYQRVVDKRVEQAQSFVGPVKIKALIDGEVQVIELYQPDLFDKSKKANKRSRQRFEVIYRKLLGEKGYNKIKHRIFYYETSADLVKDGWRAKDIEQASAFVVPENLVDNNEPIMVFVMEKIKEGDELQVFFHEVGGHIGIEGVLGDEGVKVLSKKIQKLYEEDMAKYGNEDFYTDTMEQALERSPVLNADSEAHFMARHAMRGALSPGYRDKSGTVPQDTVESESIAFFVQAAIALGADPTEQTNTGRLLKKFVDAMKKFLNIALGNTDFNMSAADVATMAWGAARIKLKGGSEFTRAMDRLNSVQRMVRGKLKMSVKDWNNSIEAAVRRNYPKNSQGKYVPYDGSFVKDWSTYQKEQYLEEKGFRVQVEAQVESIIKQAEEHEKNMFDPDKKGYKRSFKFSRPPLNNEEKAKLKKEQKRIRNLMVKVTGSEDAGYQYDTMANLAGNAIDSTKFLHEFVHEFRKILPEGVELLKVIDAAETMRNNIKQTIDDIAIQARDLSPDRQVIVDRMIAFGTQEQVWPADPGLKNKSVANGNVVVNKKFAEVFTRNLNKEEQKLVMDVYKHGELMMELKRAILKLLGLDSNSDFLGITSLDGPYAPLRRTGTHMVVLKSKEYVKLEKEFNEGSESTSTLKKKALKNKLNELKTNPKHYSYSYKLTAGEALKYYDKQIATGKWDTTEDGSKYLPKARGVGQGREPDKKVFDKVLATLSTSSLDDASRDYVEKLLKNMYMDSVEETSARQGEGKRIGRGVDGFETSMLSSFVDNGKSEANLLANMQFGKEINVVLSNARKTASASTDPKVMDVYNMLVTHYNLMLNAKDTDIMNSIASFTTAMVLTTSLGYHIQNATQPWAVSYPLLAGDFNDWRGVTPALGRGYRIAQDLISYDGKVPFIQWNKPATWQTEVNLEKIPTWVTHNIKVKGTGNLTGKKLSKTESAKRLKMWNETIKPLLLAMQEAKLLDLGIEQDLSSSVSLKPTGFDTLNKALAAGGKVSHRLYQVPRLVEAYNRIATGIAAADMAQNHRNGAKVLKAYDTTAIAYAVRLVRRTQGDFTANDAPAIIKWFTNTVPGGKLMVQFRKFGMLMGWAHVSAWKQARKGLNKEEKAMARRTIIYLLAHTMLLGGVRGLPLIGYTTALYTLITFMLGTGDDDDYDPNDTDGVIERKLMELLPDNTDLAKAIARGPANPLGVDTHTKLSQATIFSISPFVDFELSSEGFKDIGFSLFGATGANMLNIGRGFEFIGNGDYYRGVESMAPKGLKNIMESVRLGTKGYTTFSGTPMVPPESFKKFQLVLNGLGIPATDIVNLKWARSEQYQIEQFFNKKQSRLKADYLRAFDKKDRGKMLDIRKEFLKLQDAKDRTRPFFSDSKDAIPRSPMTYLTFAASRRNKQSIKAQRKLSNFYD